MKHLYFSLLFLFPLTLFAQTAITGVVKQANGQAVPYATVKIRGTNISVSADDKGAFLIHSKQELPFFLQVSSIGFKPQDFQILKLQEIPLELIIVENALLDQIVVTSRRRTEALQDVPLAITVIGGRPLKTLGLLM